MLTITATNMEHVLNAVRRAPVGYIVDIYAPTRKRSTQANRLYWRRLADIAEQALWDGRRYSKEQWHEGLASMFLGRIDLPFGRSTHVSTTDLDTTEFAEYLERVSAFATGTLGVRFVEDM